MNAARHCVPIHPLIGVQGRSARKREAVANGNSLYPVHRTEDCQSEFPHRVRRQGEAANPHAPPTVGKEPSARRLHGEVLGRCAY